MAAPKTRTDDIFQTLSNTEIDAALEFAITNGVTLIGKCDDESFVVVKPKPEGSNLREIFGLLKSSGRVKSPQEAIFSFVVGESKYLFKGVFSILHGKTVSVAPLSRFYCIQRRSNERLKIPEDYYALFKFTHINGRPFRSFGKIKNVSAGGVAVIFRNHEPQIFHGNTIRGVLTLNCRPPEDVELKIKHVATDTDGETKLQIFGGAYLPEGSPLLVRRMNSVITDIYRDIFKSMNDKKK